MSASFDSASYILHFRGNHVENEADHRAINALLKSYTESVEQGDRERFESLLLHLDIAFSGLRTLSAYEDNAEAVDVRNYPAFRAAIFESGIAFRQQFFNQKIEQDGNLAQVSLDFITTDTSAGKRTGGWKVLQLLKIRGAWKIVSELYNAQSLEDAK